MMIIFIIAMLSIIYQFRHKTHLYIKNTNLGELYMYYNVIGT